MSIREQISNQIAKDASEDRIPMKERWGQLIPLAGVALVTLFFVIHWIRPTGFFTAEYTTLAVVLTWAMAATGTAPFVVRMVTGSKKITKWFEMAGMAIGVVALVYLLVKFPFDFDYFAAPLPGALEPLLSWVPSWLGWWVLAIGAVGGAACLGYNLYLVVTKSRRLSQVVAATST